MAHFRNIPMIYCSKYIKQITEADEYEIYNIISHEIYILIIYIIIYDIFNITYHNIDICTYLYIDRRYVNERYNCS